MSDHEPLEDMTIRVADWESDQQQLKQVRRKVFIEEQQVPEAMEWDDDDRDSTHYLVTRGDETIATARLKSDGQIGRMAVLAAYRRQGIGSSLLAFILRNIEQRSEPGPYSGPYLHAQVVAIPFYERHGFSTCSSIFYEADIPHRKMQLACPPTTMMSDDQAE